MPQAMITVNIATHEARKKNLANLIKDLQVQTLRPDVVNIYYNDYTPEVARVMGMKINHHIAPDGDLKAAAKFWPQVTQGIVFLLDDDLMLSRFYIEEMFDAVRHYHQQAVITCHGTYYLCKRVDSWREEGNWWQYMDKCPVDVLVHSAGTGVMAMHSSLYNKFFQLDNFIDEPTKLDPTFSVIAARNCIPLVRKATPENWITTQERSQHTAIWRKNIDSPEFHTEMINKALELHKNC